MKWMTKKSMILALAFFVLAGKETIVPIMAIAADDGIKVPVGKLAAIKSIGVTGEGSAAELVIVLSSPATYTSYKTTAPLRLVIDLSQSSPGTIASPQVINKGNFKTVAATRFDTDAGVLTRLDVELDKDAEPVISVSPINPGELHVSFPSLVVESVPAAQVAQENKSSIEPISKDQTSDVRQTAVTPTMMQPAITARKLKSISVSADKIELAVDGGVAEFNTFRLNNPERFVIDLMDTQLAMTSRLIPLNTSGIASARIGLYPDKVRVVLDSVNGGFPDATASKSEQGLTVALNYNANQKTISKLESKHTEAAPEIPAPIVAPVPVAKEPIVSPAPVAKESTVVASAPIIKEPAGSNVPIAQESGALLSNTSQSPIEQTKAQTSSEPSESLNKIPISVRSGPASVEMIDFQVVDHISRVAVRVNGDVAGNPPIKTPGFVTLTLKNVLLPKRLQHSLETQSFISPVLRITPLNIKTRKGFETKIRIALRVVSSYEFRHEGDMFYIDFKNPEGLTAEKLPAAILETKLQTPPTSEIGKTGTNAKEIELSSELNPSSDSSKSFRAYKGRKVTLEFADAEVRKIFQLLSEVSNKNFVLGDEVTGTISIKLVNVPWDQALDIILDTKNLDKREEGNIIIIKGKGKFRSQAEEEQELKKALTRSIDLKSEIFDINYSDIAGIVLQLNNLKTDRGTIAQDTRTNKIIVKDIPQALDDMRKLITQLDVPEKQVMIEARIVEATSTFTSSLGVNWGIHYANGAAPFLGINQMDTSFGGVASTTPPASGVSGQSGGAMGISFGSLTSNLSLDVLLNAAASSGLIKIVSSPKVATLNNKSAKVTQGQQIPYTSSTSDKVETKFVEAALALEVTPHINSNGTISMKINAKNDSVGQATGGSTAPAINTKQATTEMLLRDGETTVIGGIYVDDDETSDDGVPYLMDIPFLGKLFKSNNVTKVKTELLIFITPRILTSI